MKKKITTIVRPQAESLVAQVREWIGFNQANGGRNAIIDTYNANKPLPRSYKVKYTDAWCAATIGAAVYLKDLRQIVPIECSCQQLINEASQLGIWVEEDHFIPRTGDLILYDWQDTGNGDNTGWADHVGIVEKVEDGIITAIEGNLNIDGVRQVGRRDIAINARYIRGFICPHYNEEEYITEIDVEPDNSANARAAAIIDQLERLVGELRTCLEED